MLPAPTYHPVVAQLAEPLEVVLVADALLDECGQHVPGVDVQHHQGTQSHPVLLGQLPTHQRHDVVDLPVVNLKVFI